MLVVFSPIFVVDTKITFLYNFVSPLNILKRVRLIIVWSDLYIFFIIEHANASQHPYCNGVEIIFMNDFYGRLYVRLCYGLIYNFIFLNIWKSQHQHLGTGRRN